MMTWEKKTCISVQISLHSFETNPLENQKHLQYIQTHNFGGFMIQNVSFRGYSSSGTAPTKKCFFPKPWTFTASWLNGTTILAAPFSDDGPVTTTSRDFSTCHMSRRGSSNTKREACYPTLPGITTTTYSHTKKKTALNPLLLEVGFMDVFFDYHDHSFGSSAAEKGKNQLFVCWMKLYVSSTWIYLRIYNRCFIHPKDF